MSDANTTTTPNTPAGGAVACPECGAPCETGVRYKDMSFRELVTDYMYSPPATVSADAVLALAEDLRTGGGPVHPSTEYLRGMRDARKQIADELEALTRGGK